VTLGTGPSHTSMNKPGSGCSVNPLNPHQGQGTFITLDESPGILSLWSPNGRGNTRAQGPLPHWDLHDAVNRAHRSGSSRMSEWVLAGQWSSIQQRQSRERCGWVTPSRKMTKSPCFPEIKKNRSNPSSALCEMCPCAREILCLFQVWPSGSAGICDTLALFK
jgi:hypothetical protein